MLKGHRKEGGQWSRKKGTFLHLLPCSIPSLQASPRSPVTAFFRELRNPGVSCDNSCLKMPLLCRMVDPTWNCLPFLLSASLTCLNFFLVRSLWYKWNLTPWLCLFFQLLSITNFFLLRHLRAWCVNVTCEFSDVGIKKKDEAWRMSQFLICATSRPFRAPLPEKVRLCIPASMTCSSCFRSLLRAQTVDQPSKTVLEWNWDTKVQFLNVDFPIQDFPTHSCPTPFGGVRIDSLAKTVRQVPTAGHAELFLKLRAAMTHASYSPLTSHSDSYKPTYFQICSITMTFKGNPLHAQDTEKTHSESWRSTEEMMTTEQGLFPWTVGSKK